MSLSLSQYSLLVLRNRGYLRECTSVRISVSGDVPPEIWDVPTHIARYQISGGPSGSPISGISTLPHTAHTLCLRGRDISCVSVYLCDYPEIGSSGRTNRGSDGWVGRLEGPDPRHEVPDPRWTIQITHLRDLHTLSHSSYSLSTRKGHKLCWCVFV